MDPRKARVRKRQSGGLAGLLRDIVWIVVVVVVIQSFIVQPFNIPSTSMLPGLLIGDRVVTLKFSYGYTRYSFPFSPNLFGGRVLALGQPERGDVAVFRLPADTKVDFIKRVIGLPGDRIQMRGGRLYINGAMVERRPRGDELVDDTGYPRTYRAYDEVLPGGRTHRIYERADNGPGDDTPEYVVPPGHYFMMGDNRDNSCDSRFNASFNPGGGCPQPMGFVPLENFIGRASFILFSTDGSAEFWELWKWPFAVRYGRFVKGIE